MKTAEVEQLVYIFFLTPQHNTEAVLKKKKVHCFKDISAGRRWVFKYAKGNSGFTVAVLSSFEWVPGGCSCNVPGLINAQWVRVGPAQWGCLTTGQSWDASLLPAHSQPSSRQLCVVENTDVSEVEGTGLDPKLAADSVYSLNHTTLQLWASVSSSKT